MGALQDSLAKEFARTQSIGTVLLIQINNLPSAGLSMGLAGANFACIAGLPGADPRSSRHGRRVCPMQAWHWLNESTRLVRFGFFHARSAIQGQASRLWIERVSGSTASRPGLEGISRAARIAPCPREADMSDVIRQLNKDHINIARLLDILEGQLNVLSEGGNPDYVLMTDIMQYMTNYPDLFHHPKEDVLFNRMAERDAGAVAALQDLQDKHVVLAELGARFSESLRAVLSEFMAERETFEGQGREYIATLRQHMDVEEGKVFPAAGKLLNEEDWRVIDSGVDAMEDPLFGTVVQDEYRALFDYIKHQSE
jgi:hemerythrin-like domain-containing protein